MKTKFLAGLIATLVSLVFTVGCALLMVYYELDSNKRVPYIVAFTVIAVWMGMYKWLKPKEDGENNQPTEGV